MGWWEGGGSWRQGRPRWAGEIGKWGGGPPSGEGWRREGQRRTCTVGGLAGPAPLVVPELLVPSILARQDAAPLISTLQSLPIHHRRSLISRRRRPCPQFLAEQLPLSQRWPTPQNVPCHPPTHFPPQNVGWAQPAAWLKPQGDCGAGTFVLKTLSNGFLLGPPYRSGWAGLGWGKPPVEWGCS